MTYPIRTIEDIMNCIPCHHWNTVEKIECRLGKEWSGTLEDVLDLDVFFSAKVWFIIMSGDLSDEKLEAFCTICKENGPLKEETVIVEDCEKKKDGTILSFAQEKAITYHLESCRRVKSVKAETERQLEILRTLVLN